MRLFFSFNSIITGIILCFSFNSFSCEEDETFVRYRSYEKSKPINTAIPLLDSGNSGNSGNGGNGGGEDIDTKRLNLINYLVSQGMNKKILDTLALQELEKWEKEVLNIITKNHYELTAWKVSGSSDVLLKFLVANFNAGKRSSEIKMSLLIHIADIQDLFNNLEIYSALNEDIINKLIFFYEYKIDYDGVSGSNELKEIEKILNKHKGHKSINDVVEAIKNKSSIEDMNKIPISDPAEDLRYTLKGYGFNEDSLNKKDFEYLSKLQKKYDFYIEKAKTSFIAKLSSFSLVRYFNQNDDAELSKMEDIFMNRTINNQTLWDNLMINIKDENRIDKSKLIKFLEYHFEHSKDDIIQVFKKIIENHINKYSLEQVLEAIEQKKTIEEIEKIPVVNEDPQKPVLLLNLKSLGFNEVYLKTMDVASLTSWQNAYNHAYKKGDELGISKLGAAYVLSKFDARTDSDTRMAQDPNEIEFRLGRFNYFKSTVNQILLKNTISVDFNIFMDWLQHYRNDIVQEMIFLEDIITSHDKCSSLKDVVEAIKQKKSNMKIKAIPKINHF